MTDPAPSPSPAAAPAASAPRRRSRWRRWLGWLLLLAIGGRLLLGLCLPWLLSLVGSWYGLDVTTRHIALRLLGLSLHAEDLVVRNAEQPGAAPLLVVQDLVADLSLRQLLAGELVVVDAVVAGAEVQLVRLADGRLQLPSKLLGGEPAPPPPPEAPAPVQFALPLLVRSARVHDLVVRFADQTLSPERIDEATINLDVRDLGHRDHPGQLTLRAHSPANLDQLWLAADVALQAERLELEFTGGVRGLRPDRLMLTAEAQQTLAPLPSLGASLRGKLVGTTRPEAPLQPDFQGELNIDVDQGGVRRGSLLATAGPSRIAGSRTTLPFALDVKADGLCQQLALQQARCSYGDGATDIDGALTIAGATLQALAPLLQAAGVVLPPAGIDLSGSFRAQLGTAVSAELRDVAITGGGERLSLGQLQLVGLRSDGGATSIERLELQRVAAHVHQRADGALQIAGIRLLPTPPPASAAPASAAAPATPSAAPELPPFLCQALALTELDLQFTEERHQPPTTLRLSAALRGNGIRLGQDGPPGRIEADLALADAIGALQLRANLSGGRSSLRAEVELAAERLTLQALRPWLAAAGMAPTLQQGGLRAAMELDVALAAAGPMLAMRIANLRYHDGDVDLLKIRNLVGRGLSSGRELLQIGDWRLTEPYLRLERPADGSLKLLGLQTQSTPPPPTTDTTPPPAPVPAPSAAPVRLQHGELAIAGAVVHYEDAAEAAPIDLGFDVTIAGAPGVAVPHDLSATVRLPGAVGSATASGHLGIDPLDLTVAFRAEGLNGAGLQRFLPPQVRCTLVAGEASLNARMQRMASPGTGFALGIDQLALRDRGEELAAIDRVELDVREATTARVEVATLRIDGVRALLAQTPTGMHVPGFQLLPAPPATAPPPPVPTTPPTPTTTAAATTEAAVAARAPLRLPLLAIGDVHVGIERVVLHNRIEADGEPLVLSTVLDFGPWLPRFDRDREQAQPATLRFQGTALPLCAQATATLQIDPFELAPTADLELRATGIDLTALPRMLPALAPRLSGTVKNGELVATAHARLDLRRRDPRLFGFDRPFGGEFQLEHLTFRDPAAAAPLLQIAAVDIVARAIDPRTGDVLLRSVDIDEVRLGGERSELGIDLLGIRLLPAPAAPNAPPAASPAPTASAVAPQPAATPAADAPPPPEFAVDHLAVQGLHFDWHDTTTKPVTHLPLADVDMQLHRFSTKALHEPRPVRFAAAIRGGQVELDKRVIKSSLLAGVLSSAVQAVAGAEDVHKSEPRPLLDEWRITGDLQLVPKPVGRITTSISALELPALRGLANQGGVTLADGLYDQSLAIELKGAAGLDIVSRSVFTWLSLAEPPGGPISTYLRLPAPLDTVLFLLRNDDDEHRIPVQLSVPGSGLSTGAVVGAGAEAVVAVLADAIASAAARAASMVTGAIGLGGEDTTPKIAALPFAAGDPLPPATTAAAPAASAVASTTAPDTASAATGDAPSADLDAVLAALAENEATVVLLSHELGAGDLRRAEALATPPPPIVLAQVARLQQQRQQWTAERTALAAELAAHYAGGQQQQAWALQPRLLALDHQLGELERTLDDAVAIVAGDTDRAKKRRTQAAAVALANSRLRAMAAELQRRLPGLRADRIVQKPPRSVPIDGLDDGGRVILKVRAQTAP